MNFLPGWDLGFITGGPLQNIDFIANTVSDTNSIVAPSGIIAGDLLVILQRASNSSTTIPTAVTPSGFLTANDVSQSSSTPSAFATRQIVNYKLATGAEASGSFSTMVGNDTGASVDQRSIFCVWRKKIAATSLVLASVNGIMTNGSTGAQTITSGSGVIPLLAIAVRGSFGGIDGTEMMNPLSDGLIPHPNSIGADNGLILFDLQFSESPVNVAVPSFSGEDDHAVQSMYFEMH